MPRKRIEAAPAKTGRTWSPIKLIFDSSKY
jgi:hypothetical protein